MWRWLKHFYQQGLWEADLRRVSAGRRLLFSTLRVAADAARAFFVDLGGLRASGLTLVTVLALVPLLAMATGIANGLGYGTVLDAQIERFSTGLPEGMQPAMQKVRELVQRTSFAALGAIGSLLLAYSGMRLFVRVEQAFNRIWNLPRGRSWYRRVTDFVALVVLVPLLIVGAISLQSVLQGAQWFDDVAWLQWAYRQGLGIVPHVLAWFALTAAYKIIPSAPVRWTSALLGGVIAGSGWVFVHGVYLSTQVGVARFNAIYATLAALPLLLVYLQVTWTIVLVGAQIAYSWQHRDRLRAPHSQRRPPFAVRLRLALHLTAAACEGFARGDGGARLDEVSDRLDVPVEWLRDVFADLGRAGLLDTAAARGVVVPMQPPDEVTAGAVVQAVTGEVPAELGPGLALRPELQEALERADAQLLDGLGSLPLTRN